MFVGVLYSRLCGNILFETNFALNSRCGIALITNRPIAYSLVKSSKPILYIFICILLVRSFIIYFCWLPEMVNKDEYIIRL